MGRRRISFRRSRKRSKSSFPRDLARLAPGPVLHLLLGGLLTLAVLAVTGCGAPAPSNSPPPVAASAPAKPSATDSAAAAAPVSIKEVPAASLPIGDYLPPLDDDRLEVAIPKDWHTLPRDSNYVARFYRTDRNGLPRIEVKVEQRAFGDLETVTRNNVETFVTRVAAELESDKTDLLEPVVPLVLGDVACARYVSRVGLKLGGATTITAERQRLLVLNRGRLYTIDLLVLPETILQSRDAAYAVCASLRFL